MGSSRPRGSSRRSPKESKPPSDNQAVNGPVFRFRLERVRAVRERTEQLARQELARAISLRSSTEADLRAAEAHLEQAHIEHRAHTDKANTLGASELIGRQAFLERIEAQRGAQIQELRQREAQVSERDAKLTTAATEHEMLNRLRERHRDEYERELANRERTALDEIAAARFGRSAT
jgi:flagellar export protein FliJ